MTYLKDKSVVRVTKMTYLKDKSVVRVQPMLCVCAG